MSKSIENVIFKVTIEVVKETGWSDKPILAKAVVEDGGLIEHPDVMAGRLAEVISSASERVHRQLRQTVAIKKLEQQRSLAMMEPEQLSKEGNDEMQRMVDEHVKETE